MYINNLKEVISYFESIGVTITPNTINKENYISKKRKEFEKNYKKDFSNDKDFLEFMNRKITDDDYWNDSNCLIFIKNNEQYIIAFDNNFEYLNLDKIKSKYEKLLKNYNTPYGQFAKMTTKLLMNDKHFENSCVVYPTTYGIGVSLLWNADDDIKLLKTILNNKQIEYYNEYSDAQWVYRFKISKKKENLERISK